MLVTGDYSRTPPFPDIDYRLGGFEVYLHRLRPGAGAHDLRAFAEARLSLGGTPSESNLASITSVSRVSTQTLADEVAGYGAEALGPQSGQLGTEPTWGVMVPLANRDSWLLIEANGDHVSALFLHGTDGAGGASLAIGMPGGSLRLYFSHSNNFRAPTATRPGWRWLAALTESCGLPEHSRQRLIEVLEGVGWAVRSRPRRGLGQQPWAVRAEGTPNRVGLLAAFTAADLQAALGAA